MHMWCIFQYKIAYIKSYNKDFVLIYCTSSSHESSSFVEGFHQVD